MPKKKNCCISGAGQGRRFCCSCGKLLWQKDFEFLEPRNSTYGYSKSDYKISSSIWIVLVLALFVVYFVIVLGVVYPEDLKSKKESKFKDRPSGFYARPGDR